MSPITLGLFFWKGAEELLEEKRPGPLFPLSLELPAFCLRRLLISLAAATDRCRALLGRLSLPVLLWSACARCVVENWRAQTLRAWVVWWASSRVRPPNDLSVECIMISDRRLPEVVCRKCRG